MNQKSKKGMWLHQTGNGQNTGSGWIVPMVSALLACVVLILAAVELTGFDMLYTPWVMLLSGGGLCIAYGIMTRFCRQNWFYPGVFFLLLILVLLFGRKILSGFCLFWNQMGDIWTIQTGWVLPELEILADSQESSVCLLLFSVFIGIVSALLCCSLTACRVPVLAPLLLGMLLTGMIVFCRENSFPYLLPVLLAAVCLLLCGGWKGKNEEISAIVCRLVPTVLACVILLAVTSVPAVRNWATQISDDLHKKAHIHRYETEYTTLPEGDFSDYLENQNTEQPALVVSMEIPEEMYLRGFTGAVFKNDTWTAMDPQVLAENEDLLYWLNLNEFNTNSQFEKAILQTEITKNTVTIQNIGACSRYLYVPFNLCSGSYLQAENLSSDGIVYDGERIYVVSTVSGGAELIDQTLEYLQTSDEEEVQAYRKAESAYRDFVYRYYLQIPQEVTDMLGQYWEKAAAQYGTAEELTFLQAQECALAFLDEYFPEDGNAASIKLPLEMAAGSSYQYATVAALTLRYFGIPARYAEGYIITEEAAAAAENGSSIKVDSSCSSGWVEVYQDGIGWIPMSLTHGLEKMTKNPDDSQDSGEKDSEKPNLEEGKELEETPDDVTEEPEPNGGYVTSVPKMIIWSGLLILFFLILLLIFLIVRRKVLLGRRQKRFDEESKKDAVAWIFADTVILLEKLGFKRGNGSMYKLFEPILEKYGEGYAAAFENVVCLNARAMFSSRELEEVHREEVLIFREETLQYLKNGSKWYARLWMKWIRCLY